MKNNDNKKQELSSINLINKLSEGLYSLLGKLKKHLNKLNIKVLIKFALKIIVFVVLITLVEIFTRGLYEVGSLFIEMISRSFYQIFGNIWKFFLFYSYFLFTIAIFYSLIRDMYLTKNSFSFSKKEENNIKINNSFSLMLKFIKVFGYLALIPLFILIAINLVLIGVLIAIFFKSQFVISLFFLLLASLIYLIFTTNYVEDIFSLHKIKNYNLYIAMIALAIFLISFNFLFVEIRKYQLEPYLPGDFKLNKEVLNYEINKDKKIKIVSINEVEVVYDKNLNDTVKIEIINYNTVQPKVENVITKEENLIGIKYDTNIKLSHLKEIFNLGVNSLKNKKRYKYTDLIYGNVIVYVNPANKEQLAVYEQHR